MANWVILKMTTCSLLVYLLLVASGEVTIYKQKITMNKLSIEPELFIILFKLAQWVKFGLALI